MRMIGIICMLLISAVLLSGCIQLPGYYVISDTPDPVVGQWIGGEPPQSEVHMVFYENHTFIHASFFINRGEVTEIGNWTKVDRGFYSARSINGSIINWTYDAFGDFVYVREIPLLKYYRYKG